MGELGIGLPLVARDFSHLSIGKDDFGAGERFGADGAFAGDAMNVEGHLPIASRAGDGGDG